MPEDFSYQSVSAWVAQLEEQRVTQAFIPTSGQLSTWEVLIEAIGSSEQGNEEDTAVAIKRYN